MINIQVDPNDIVSMEIVYRSGHRFLFKSSVAPLAVSARDALFMKYTDDQMRWYLIMCDIAQDRGLDGMSELDHMESRSRFEQHDHINSYFWAPRVKLIESCIALNEDVENTVRRMDETFEEYPVPTKN